MTKKKPDKEWVLLKVVNVTPSLDYEHLFSARGYDVREEIDKTTDITLLHTIHRGELDPASLTRLPDFKLLTVKDGPSPNLVQIDFEYTFNVPDSKESQAVVSHLVLDRDLGWLPVELRQSMEYQGEITTQAYSRTLTKTEQGYHQKVMISDKTVNAQSKIEQNIERHGESDWSFGDFPETDFTLSHFGLPEPPGIDWKKPIPAYLWALLVGVVLLVTFVILRIWRRRREQVKVA